MAPPEAVWRPMGRGPAQARARHGAREEARCAVCVVFCSSACQSRAQWSCGCERFGKKKSTSVVAQQARRLAASCYRRCHVSMVAPKCGNHMRTAHVQTCSLTGQAQSRHPRYHLHACSHMQNKACSNTHTRARARTQASIYTWVGRSRASNIGATCRYTRVQVHSDQGAPPLQRGAGGVPPAANASASVAPLSGIGSTACPYRGRRRARRF